MKVLKSILSESKSYYLKAKKKIQQKLSRLPKGSVKKREIAGNIYFYLQKRVGKKIVHKYIGKNRPESLLQDIKMRKALKKELKKINEALRIIKRSEGRKHD